MAESNGYMDHHAPVNNHCDDVTVDASSSVDNNSTQLTEQ